MADSARDVKQKKNIRDHPLAPSVETHLSKKTPSGASASLFHGL